MTDKLKAAAEMALEALDWVVKDNDSYDPFDDKWDDVHKSIHALRQALAEPDTTKMIDTGIDRGAWADVPNATKWVDELRGDDDELPPVKTYCGGKPNYCEPRSDAEMIDFACELEAKLKEKNGF